MKILKTDNFVSERVKVKAVTNAEWQDIQDKINNFRKIENPSLEDIKEGNVVCIKDDMNTTHVYIVFNSMKLPWYFKNDITKNAQYPGNMLMIRYDKSYNDYAFRQSVHFINNFPFDNHFDSVKITDIYDAKIDTMGIQHVEDLKREWETVCEKIKKY